MRAGIVGAGIMGRVLAWMLKREGWKVSVFDPSPNQNCSAIAAGLLTPHSEFDRSSATIAELGLESIRVHWPKILSGLPEPVYFQQEGSIVIHHPGDAAEWALYSKKSSDLTCVRFDQQYLHALEPDLQHFHEAYFYSDEAQVDAGHVFRLLEQELTHAFVQEIKPHQIKTDQQHYTFDCVFDTRGLGARDIWPNLRAIRGELICVEAPAVNFHRPIRLLHPRYSLYIAPRPHHRYILGASEIETEDYGPISVRTALELLTAAYSIHSGFADAKILQTATHCRPAFSDHEPRIEAQKGLVRINGLYRHGYLIAPALANRVLESIGVFA